MNLAPRLAGLSLVLSVAACGSAFEEGGTGASATTTATTGAGAGATTGAGGGSTDTGAGGGATSTGSGGGSTGTGSGGGGGTTTTTSGAEDCTNGVDDDQNGAVDCADAACADVACTPILPGGWEGPVWLARGVEVPAPCPPGSSTLAALNVGPPVAPDAGCSSCTCSPSGGTCASTVDVLAYQDGACEAGNTEWAGVSDGDCKSLTVGGTLAVFLGPRAVDDPPTCAGVVQPDVPPAMALADALLCKPDAVGAGCAKDAVCQGPTGGLDTCVVKDGEHECPDGAFSVRTILYGDLNDERGCECACGAALTSDCPAHLELHKDAGCGGDTVGSAVEDVCAAIGNTGATTMNVVLPPALPQATCGLPTKTGPIGGVTMLGTLTVCCAP